MDTKLKNNNQNKILGIMISTLVIISLAIAMIASYEPMLEYSTRLSQKLSSKREEVFQRRKEYYKEEFVNVLERSNYILYWDLVLGKDNSMQLPSDVFLEHEITELKEGDTWYDQKENFVNNFNNVLYNWHSNFYDYEMRNYPLFEYYILDNSSESQLTNSYNSIERLLGTSQDVEEIKELYPFYIIFQYGEDHSLQISDYSGLEEEQINNLLLREQNKEILKNEMYIDYWYQYNSQIKTPSDVTIVYASQSEEFYISDGAYYNTQSHPINDFSEGCFGYAYAFVIILIIIFALLLSLKKSWGIGQGFASHIPLELALFAVFIMITAYEGLLYMTWETVTGYFLIAPEQSVLSTTILNILDYGFNFIVWVLVLWVWYVAVLSVRQVFVLGLWRYLKEKTITGRVLWFLIVNIRKTVMSLGTIDLTDKSNKAIIKILAVNFIILAILCSVWIVGIAVLIPYSILLFFALRKYYDDVRKKYAVLLEAASKMAGGNLEVAIEENLGIFEPLKSEFSKVQHGFKKAVEDEMKSQRLKTDLITNVSHDLKTPLTAIITYVDLLKDANITPEERQSYIDTLDMKAQRLKRLIEDLFEVSKASSNNITLNIVEIDLVDLIKQVLLELDDKITQSGVEVRLHLPKEKVLLCLDSEKSYRIFENLISNITKYAMPHTRAYIMIEEEVDKITVMLKNVSSTELDFNTEEITDRFVRGDQSRNLEGSGLGLAIVKSFVELQGGKFQIIIDGDLFKAVITLRREKK